MKISRNKLRIGIIVSFSIFFLSIVLFLLSFLLYGQFNKGKEEKVSFSSYYFDSENGPLTIAKHEYVGHFGSTSWSVPGSKNEYKGNDYLYRVRLVDKKFTINEEHYCTIEVNNSMPHFHPKPKLLNPSNNNILVTKIKSFMGSPIFIIIIIVILLFSFGAILLGLKKLILS